MFWSKYGCEKIIAAISALNRAIKEKFGQDDIPRNQCSTTIHDRIWHELRELKETIDHINGNKVSLPEYENEQGHTTNVTHSTVSGTEIRLEGIDDTVSLLELINKVKEYLAKDDVGLGNVTNTTDMDKPVSTAQAQAIQAASASVHEALTAEIADRERGDTATLQAAQSHTTQSLAAIQNRQYKGKVGKESDLPTEGNLNSDSYGLGDCDLTSPGLEGIAVWNGILSAWDIYPDKVHTFSEEFEQRMSESYRRESSNTGKTR